MGNRFLVQFRHFQSAAKLSNLGRFSKICPSITSSRLSFILNRKNTEKIPFKWLKKLN